MDQSSSNYRESSFNVNGMRSAFNNFEVDGVDNNSYNTSNQGYSNQAIQLSPDAVAEFKVQTDNFSAEYGRAGGAIVNISLKSGTNSFHGAAWDFLRNTSLNAVGFFKPALGKPVFQQNQFGAAFGGRIIRNKTLVPDHPHDGSTQRHLRPPHPQSLHGRHLFRRPDSEVAAHTVCGEGLRPTGSAHHNRHRQQLPGAAAHSHRGQQGRHPPRPLFQYQGDGVRTVQPPRIHADRHPDAAPATRLRLE
jgi:hypothetical protein